MGHEVSTWEAKAKMENETIKTRGRMNENAPQS